MSLELTLEKYNINYLDSIIELLLNIKDDKIYMYYHKNHLEKHGYCSICFLSYKTHCKCTQNYKDMKNIINLLITQVNISDIKENKWCFTCLKLQERCVCTSEGYIEEIESKYDEKSNIISILNDLINDMYPNIKVDKYLKEKGHCLECYSTIDKCKYPENH